MLGSPFDYAAQATVYLETGLPEPSDALRFLPAACDRIEHYLRQTNGGAFVLFTSYRMLIDAANRMKSRVDALGLPLLVQGQQVTRKVLLDQFRVQAERRAVRHRGVLAGDRRAGGRAAERDHREAAVRRAGRAGGGGAAWRRSRPAAGNAFMQYSVPEAIIKLKQGFGRLIRSRTDTGIVAILDSRVKTKRYGKLFLDALPDCRVVEVGGTAGE